MKIISTRILLVALTLLLCGVATADPSSRNHDVTSHQELSVPWFCAASYVLHLNTIWLDPTISSAYKMEIRSRTDGLITSIDQYMSDIGHNDDAAVAAYATMYSDVEDMYHNHPSEWTRLIKDSDCKGMTEQWAFISGGDIIL